ncbi:IclR family transcriptional regulator [Castellaniella sp.]|uniref:IclR family transcriptional regulator n=1 Tax=Castellaniella sp. TaxID=1955812 RepID=UPI003C77A6A6
MSDSTEKPVERADPPGGVGAVKKALMVLGCFSGAEPLLSVTELARRVGLHKSSVSRIVATLEEAQFVERDPASGMIRLGGGLVALAAPVMENFGLSELVRNGLQELAATTQETCSFNIWDGEAAVSIEHVRGSHPVSHYAPLGLTKPAWCTATGKVLLAFAPDKVMERVVAAPLVKYTEATLTDIDAIRAELRTVRTLNFAVNRGEFYPDVGAVASAVRGKGDRLIGAVGITVPMYRFTEEKILFLQKPLTTMAEFLSKQLSAM